MCACVRLCHASFRSLKCKSCLHTHRENAVYYRSQRVKGNKRVRLVVQTVKIHTNRMHKMKPFIIIFVCATPHQHYRFDLFRNYFHFNFNLKVLKATATTIAHTRIGGKLFIKQLLSHPPTHTVPVQMKSNAEQNESTSNNSIQEQQQ